MFYRKFVFGRGTDTAGSASISVEDVPCQTRNEQKQEAASIRVTPEDLYRPGKGYGFVVERNRREEDCLKLPELNSAFDTVYWYQDAELSHLEEDEDGCFLDSDAEIQHLERMTGEKLEGEKRRIPLSFKVDLPSQGNYRVTVKLRAEEPEEVLVFTGRRRLGFRGISDGKSEYAMTVNVCDIIPRGCTEVYEDRTLDITVVADKPGFSIVTVEEVECPTIYIAGDSTVTDQTAEYPYAPGTSYSGWGQMLSAYVNGKIAVSNHAHSGLTTESFRQEGHYGIVEHYIKKGDFLFCQFGHNDQKLDHLKAEEGYRDNLLRYIRESRERGVFPLIVTPIARNTWKGNDGAYNDLLEAHANACIRLGKEEDVPVLDLHKLSMEFIIAHGLEASKSYFFPGDYTHSNDYGAYFMAGLVAQEILRVCGERKEPEYRFLADCVTGGFGPWTVPERIVSMKKPAIFENAANPEEVQVLDHVENPTEPADRVSALDMVIKAARFFPTNVYNDMFTDVVGHEWYAGTVECAYQNGMIDAGLVEDRKFFPLQPVTMEEFLVFAINGYKSRKTLPVLEGESLKKCSVYDGKCREFAKPYVRAACALGLIAPDGGTELNRVLTRGEAAGLCKGLF